MVMGNFIRDGLKKKAEYYSALFVSMSENYLLL
ncbi:MAG: hypothetical protein ACI9Z3_002038 [Roseivirga sp.]|jgi:hypothetical protein